MNPGSDAPSTSYHTNVNNKDGPDRTVNFSVYGTQKRLRCIHSLASFTREDKTADVGTFRGTELYTGCRGDVQSTTKCNSTTSEEPLYKAELIKQNKMNNLM